MIRATLAVILLLFSPALAAEIIVGRASVIDGDTIEINGERIRFNGIDAPESRQFCGSKAGMAYRCGKVAADALDAFLAQSRPTRCEFVNRDRYKRIVGNCYRADGENVSAWMVKHGHALDWPRYSKGRFAVDQATAKANAAGIWQGSFDLPWEWRKN